MKDNNRLSKIYFLSFIVGIIPFVLISAIIPNTFKLMNSILMISGIIFPLTNVLYIKSKIQKK